MLLSGTSLSEQTFGVCIASLHTDWPEGWLRKFREETPHNPQTYHHGYSSLR